MALEAAEQVAGRGISVEVVDIRTLVPFDEESVFASVRKTGRVLVAHEAVLTGGFGGEIAARIAQQCVEWLDAPIVRVAAFDSPTPLAPTLESAVLPNASKILAAVEQLLSY